jgi:hypothetical protein
MTNVRESRRADELKTGDWLAAGTQAAVPVEVLDVYPFTDSDGPAVLLVYRNSVGRPVSIPADADQVFELATQDELNAGREVAERAQKIADIRAYVDWLEANPSEPVGYGFGGQVDVPGGDAEAVAKVRAFAARYGAEVRDVLEDRTTARLRFGSVEHVVIAWHRDGRPAEPGREPVGEASCYVPNGFQAPEVIAERRAHCAASHPGRACDVPAEPEVESR